MAQLPRLTSPYMLIAACRFQNTPTWGRGERSKGENIALECGCPWWPPSETS